MKISTASRLAEYLFALFVGCISIWMFWVALVWWERNTWVAVGATLAGTAALMISPYCLWTWNKTSKLWAHTEQLWDRSARLDAYTARLWWETDRIYAGANGERALCGTCQRRLPALAFQVGESGSLTCARCSPEAKAAGRGSYEPIRTHVSTER